jgi:hypothetical protein
MPNCPVCESFQIVIVLSPWPSAWCDACGARWIQEGSEQRSIMREPVAFAGHIQRIAMPARSGALAFAARAPSGFAVDGPAS